MGILHFLITRNRYNARTGSPIFTKFGGGYVEHQFLRLPCGNVSISVWVQDHRTVLVGVVKLANNLNDFQDKFKILSFVIVIHQTIVRVGGLLSLEPSRFYSRLHSFFLLAAKP